MAIDMLRELQTFVNSVHCNYFGISKASDGCRKAWTRRNLILTYCRGAGTPSCYAVMLCQLVQCLCLSYSFGRIGIAAIKGLVHNRTLGRPCDGSVRAKPQRPFLDKPRAFSRGLYSNSCTFILFFAPAR